MPRLSSLRFPAIAFFLGAGSVAGYAPLNWFAIPLLALAGLFFIWHRVASAREAALTGFAFGLGLFGVGCRLLGRFGRGCFG